MAQGPALGTHAPTAVMLAASSALCLLGAVYFISRG